MNALAELSSWEQAYGQDGVESPHPLDGELNLPDERYSLELRRRVAEETAKSFFDETRVLRTPEDLIGEASCALVRTHRPQPLSDDIYRYVFDGRMLLSGHNPYAASPAAIAAIHPELAEPLSIILEWSRFTRRPRSWSLRPEP